jgi:uncharacterized membrane protein YedE/YeeE
VKRLALAFAAGVLFTLGLVFSGMTQPRKVRGFLDVFGAWDASLSLVMLGAVVVYALIFRSSRGRSAPWFGGSFQRPAAREIDLRLLAGALLFGIGWGMTGLCPGPAVAALATWDGRVLAFLAAMLLGMWLVGKVLPRVAERGQDDTQASGALQSAAGYARERSAGLV